MSSSQTSPLKAFYPLLTFVLLALLTFIGIWVNSHGPFQRDGSFFLYIAQQIRFGESPYYAVIDSKNPLVEYYWALLDWILPTENMLATARIAEGLFLLMTVMLAIRFVTNRLHSLKLEYLDRLLLLTGAISIWLLSHWVVVDNGLNIALYQTLPELAVIWLCWQLLERPQPDFTKNLIRGATLGLLLFGAWFTKQTTLISLFFPIVYLMLRFRRRVLKRETLLSATATAFTLIVCLSLWLLYLLSTASFESFYEGTIAYNAQVSRSGLSSQNKSFGVLFQDWSFPFSYHPYIFVILCALAPLLPALWVKKSSFSSEHKDLLCVLWFWLFGILFQAIGKFTFFRHYFLAGIVPALLLLTMLLVTMIELSPRLKNTLRSKVGKSFTLIVILVAVSLISRNLLQQREGLKQQVKDSSQFSLYPEIAPLLASGGKIFNWSGIMHPFVFSNYHSPYPLNQWWFFIRRYWLKGHERDDYMKEFFRGRAPDIVLEQWESYPPNQLLDSFPLTEELLQLWTGHTYIIIWSKEGSDQRYGLPAKIYKRVD